jgi:deleted-in-malignant-brain-tumors protein 1
VFNNSELEQNANDVCGDDQLCRFDIATTDRIEIGLANRNSVQRIEEIFELSLPGKDNNYGNSSIHAYS